MQTIDWAFSVDTGLGTRVASLGLMGATGVPFVASQQTAYSSEVVDDTDGYVWSKTLVPPTLTAGVLVLHAVVSGPANITVANVVARFGGFDMTTEPGARISQSENHVFEFFAYIFVSNLADFASNLLELDMAGVFVAGTVNLCANVVFFSGVDQDAAGVFLDVGTVDVFASPLGLDPGPSTDYEIVITAAAVARLSALSADPALTLTTDLYTQSDDTVSMNAGKGAVGWYFCDVSYNCACETDPDAQTLEELRTEVLTLSGYAMQAANPPPGVAAQYNAYLRTAQAYLVTKYKALETERFFSWTLTPGIRYYGLRDNRNCCDVKLNKYRITGAWLQDLNNVWWPLIDGIDPTFYTLNVNFGWPAYYEVRSCIEIFPAPQAAYTLWIKGHFELLPFTDDADVTTISAEPVKNWATFLAKSAKGAPDANTYAAMAKDQVGQLISGAHRSRRYIPGTSEIPVPTPPVMVHFDA